MTRSSVPRIEINLAKIAHNAETLKHMYKTKGIELMGVTKGVCGSPAIARVLVESGIHTLAESKLANLKKMHENQIQAQYVLLRTPALSEVESVINYADISMNSELIIIKKLSETAIALNKVHKIILMIEMGDLREGIMPSDINQFIQQVVTLPGVKIVGLGANFACFGGVKPTQANMASLSSLAATIEVDFSLSLSYVSGGNSANYNWFMEAENTERINNLRLGESILLGRETLCRKTIPDLFTDAFTFVAEVIESKIKPSVPYGEIGQDAFGNTPQFQDKGQINRAILGVGLQDVLVSGLTPILNIEILGSSSDHIVLATRKVDLGVGSEVKFSVNYGALLSAMTSPYVAKKYTHTAKTR